MKHSVFAAFLVVAVVTPGVFAQTLQQRIDEVRRKQQLERQRDEAKPRWEFLQALLYKKLSVDFDKTPARDAFDFLQTALDVNLIVRYSDDPVGHDLPTVGQVHAADAAVDDQLRDFTLEQRQLRRGAHLGEHCLVVLPLVLLCARAANRRTAAAVE